MSPLREDGDFSVSAGHFAVVAEQRGIFIGPTIVTAGHFSIDANISGFPDEDVQIIAGRFAAGAELKGAAIYPDIGILAGHFSADTSIPQPGVMMSVPCRFSMDTTIHGNAYIIGMLAIVGHFEAELELLAGTDRYVWWLTEQPATAKLIYICTLTGDGDGVNDTMLPISTFQSRMYDSGRSFLSVTIPNKPLHINAVKERLNGNLIIQRGFRYEDGSSVASEIIRAGGLGLRYDNTTITLSGGSHELFAYDPSVPKTAKLVSKRKELGGNLSLIIEPINGLYPGDNVTIDGESHLIKQVRAAVGKGTHRMEVVTNGPS